MALVDEIEMGIDLHDMDRAVFGAVLGKGIDAGDVDGMVAAQHHRQRTGLKDLAHPEFNVRVALHRVGVHDIGVADVDDGDLAARKIGDVVLVVVGAAMAEGEQRGGLADGARPETGAGTPLGAAVEGRAEDRDIGVDGVPIRLVGVFAEGADADEWQVQAAGLIGIAGHGRSVSGG